MAEKLESYKEELRLQKEEILVLLAQLGIGDWHDAQISVPEDDSPLREIVYAIKLVAENLAFLADERDKAIEEAQEKIELIMKQSQAILELSTPVIEIWDDILVCPLVGAIDTMRAQQILENLLQTIVAKQASVAILDITGVPIVDTQVANHLLMTVTAARVIGAQAILTGVSPENAYTLARLGVDLNQLIIKGSLQRGLRLAFHLTEHRVVRTAERD